MSVYVGFEIEIESKDKLAEDLHTLADRSSAITGLMGKELSDYHETKENSAKGLWRLEEDSSLRYGAEFISPPTPINKALEDLKAFLNLVSECNCETTSRCGLHMNMSLENKEINIEKMNSILSLVNHRLLFKLWGNRLKTTNHVRDMKTVFGLCKDRDLCFCKKSISKNLNKETELLSKSIVCARSNFINLRKYDGKQYIEIRIMGGEDYHKRYSAIETTARHFEKILENTDVQKVYKPLVSYINRIINNSEKDSLFNPVDLLQRLGTINKKSSILEEKITLLKNIHKYKPKEILEKISEFGHSYFCAHNGDPTLTNLRVESYNTKTYELYRYFYNYIYSIEALTRQKTKEKLYNYTMYHTLKYICNNISKTECIAYLNNANKRQRNKKYDFSIPSDEPRRETLWLLGIMKYLPKSNRSIFIDGLDTNMINFLSKNKRPGMINLVNKRKKTNYKKK